MELTGGLGEGRQCPCIDMFVVAMKVARGYGHDTSSTNGQNTKPFILSMEDAADHSLAI